MNKLTFLDIPLFEGLDRVHKATLLQEFTQLSYSKGDLLFEEGEFGDSLYIIMQGKARIYLGSGASESTLAILGEKEYFGEMALLTGDPRSASAMAESDLVVLKLYKESFDRILYGYNALAVQFAGILAKRLAQVNRQSRSDELSHDTPVVTETMVSEGIGATGTISRQAEQSGGIHTAQENRRSPLYRALSMTVSLLSGALCYYVMQAGSQPVAVCVIGAISLTSFLLVACRLASLPLASAFIAAAAVLMPGIEFDSGAAASVGSRLITALALAMSAQAVYRTGVVQRLLLRAALFFQGKGMRFGAIIELMSVLSVLLLPSSRLRNEAFACLQLKDRESCRSDAYSILFIQSSILCWFALAILPASLANDNGFMQWMVAVLPVAAIMVLSNVVIMFLRREEKLAAPDHSIMTAQLSIMGSWSIKETIALIIMLGGSMAMALAPWLGVSLLVVSLLMVLAFAACGLLGKETAGEVRYEPFIVFALLGGAAAMYEGVGIQRLTAAWVNEHMTAVVALLTLFAVVLLLSRFIPPMMAIFAGLICIGAGSVEAGASPAQTAVIAVLASQCQFGGLFAKGERNLSVVLKIIPACLAVLLTVPLWHWVPQGSEMSASSSMPAMKVGSDEVLQVPFAVNLPKDEIIAASIKQGVELAVADSRLRSASPSLELMPDYRGGRETGPGDALPPVFAISAADQDFGGSQSIPAFILDGAEAASKNTIALTPTPDVYAKEVTELLSRQGYGKIVIYYEDSDCGKQFAASLEKAADRKGIAVVDRLIRIAAQSALTASWDRWKLLGTEAVVVYDGSGAMTGAIGADIRLANAKFPLIVGPSVRGVEFLSAYEGEVYGFTDFDVNASRVQTAAFVERYRNAYGTAPSRQAAAAYDAVRLMALSAGLAGSAEPARMYETLIGSGIWEGAMRRYEFNTGNAADSGKLVHILSLTPKSGRTEGVTR
ncbi:cyclic nucleotide-binding domain-containing protein [Paenibacillus hamazuiensis]|uniref:cyclic nucleotide-binding domain-containing protein n=1 Tax=Paenibacillus hamazuiensis TaxID=2936508 RepID=UPI00200BF1EB|nr:cyclic nucleotide-binding domain-containing protein [Paenibacillus hamazuiensis]